MPAKQQTDDFVEEYSIQILCEHDRTVNTEFENIVDNFVRGDGWLFQDLGIVAKKANIGDIYRCVCTVVNRAHDKEDRLEHFGQVNVVILDCAKIQWLAPWRDFVLDPSKGGIPPFLKRQIGGFFLLYMLYTSQPVANRFHKKQRIVMNSKDLRAMHVFNMTMQRLPKVDAQRRELGKQLVTIFNDLVRCEAFEFSAAHDTFVTPTLSVRQLLASKMCIFTKIIYILKDIRDQLHYVTYNESTKVFISLATYGKYLPKKVVPANKSREANTILRGKRNLDTETDSFAPADQTWTPEEIVTIGNEDNLGKIAHSISCILKSLNFGPILTSERITGVAENLLEKEVNSYVNVYETNRRTQEINSIRFQKRKRTDLSEAKSKIHWTILKKYYSGKYDWVEQFLRGEDATEVGMTCNMRHENFTSNVKKLSTCEDDNGEWPEDMEVNDELDVGNDIYETSYTNRLLSMPNIL